MSKIERITVTDKLGGEVRIEVWQLAWSGMWIGIAYRGSNAYSKIAESRQKTIDGAVRRLEEAYA